MPQLPDPAVAPGEHVPRLAQRHRVRTARGHHHDPLAVERRRRHPPRRKLVLPIPVPQPPVPPFPKGVDAAALCRHHRVPCPARHHQHRLAVKHRPRHQRRRRPVVLVAQPEPPVSPITAHEQVAGLCHDARVEVPSRDLPHVRGQPGDARPGEPVGGVARP